MIRSATVLATALLWCACGRPMSVELSKPSLSVALSGQAQLSVTLHDAPSEAQLTLEGAPEGLTFSPAKLAASAEAQALTFSASPTAAVGVAHVKLIATAGNQTVSTPLDVEVFDGDAFAITVNPELLVLQGGAASTRFTVKSRPTRSVSGTVQMSIDGTLPQGVTITPDDVTLSGDAAAEGTLRATAAASSALGSTTLALVARAGSYRAVIPFRVTVVDPSQPDFELAAPVQIFVRRGAQTELSVKLTARNGFSQPVVISIANLPAGVSAAAGTATVTAPARLSVRADAAVAPGDYLLNLTGTS